MKSILASIATIAALGALVAGSTVALFNDQEVIAGNTVATGTLDLTLNHTAGKPYSISDAYPGFEDNWEWIDIYNTGEEPFEAYMSFEQTGGDEELYEALSIRLETAGGDGTCDTDDFEENLIYDGLLDDFPDSKLVSTLNYWHLANEDDASGSPADNIRVGYTERVCQQLYIEDDVEDIMGMETTFSEIVDAVQDND